MRTPEGIDAERLSDRILFALELALEQSDLEISEKLLHAMDMSMTRNTGGGEFVERRDYPPVMEKAVERFFELKKQKEAVG
ncbi:MAG: hypothetical protein EOM26_01465 [Alphaproteobacteria bacterium]|nr:hypothetical protein [Alphaproteobacteria bacterium]